MVYMSNATYYYTLLTSTIENIRHQSLNACIWGHREYPKQNYTVFHGDGEDMSNKLSGDGLDSFRGLI